MELNVYRKGEVRSNLRALIFAAKQMPAGDFKCGYTYLIAFMCQIYPLNALPQRGDGVLVEEIANQIRAGCVACSASIFAQQTARMDADFQSMYHGLHVSAVAMCKSFGIDTNELQEVLGYFTPARIRSRG